MVSSTVPIELRFGQPLQDGPLILVGHSWGGVVISEAGVDPKVAGLVYVAALVPDVGEVDPRPDTVHATNVV